jgi:hypothetical protein
MTGPEHYREAEQLLTGALKHRITENGDWQDDAERHRIADALTAEAQVHATLALTAAFVTRPHIAIAHIDDAGAQWAKALTTTPEGGAA